MENPYSPPAVADAPSQRLPRGPWLRRPAFVVLFLGCFGFVEGVVGIVAFFVKVSMLGFHMPDATLQGGTILWFGFGVSWMISGWCLRTGRWGLGVLGMVLGILVPFLILGMLYSP